MRTATLTLSKLRGACDKLREGGHEREVGRGGVNAAVTGRGYDLKHVK